MKLKKLRRDDLLYDIQIFVFKAKSYCSLSESFDVGHFRFNKAGEMIYCDSIF